MLKHKTCTSNLLNLPLPTQTAKINSTIIKMHVHTPYATIIETAVLRALFDLLLMKCI